MPTAKLIGRHWLAFAAFVACLVRRDDKRKWIVMPLGLSLPPMEYSITNVGTNATPAEVSLADGLPRVGTLYGGRKVLSKTVNRIGKYTWSVEISYE